MKPLLVLLSVFVASLVVLKVIRGNYEPHLSARIAISAMLIFTAVTHFVFAEGMTAMLPPFVPYKKEVVFLTGLIEIAAAIGLFVPAVRLITAWLLLAFFVLILPANIYAAMHQVDYQKGTADGNGLMYLWFRVPLQIFFIVWVYFSAIRTKAFVI